MSCFHFLAVIHTATVKISVQVFVQTYIFVSLGYITRSGIAGSFGNSVFNSLRNCQATLHSGSTAVHPASSVQGLQFLHVSGNA